MSEHQIVAFRAIDKPVRDKDLQYMRTQSSHAEVTAWSFDNEYHFGDFHGNALEMMRRGYDIHVHYANFGIRKLLIRLPHGLPDKAAAKAYFEAEGLRFIKDKQGVGGTLCVEPFHEPGELEEIWDVDSIIERLKPLRDEIVEGDLRPLYLAHLAMACDGNHAPEETIEAPVPAGLDKLSDAQRALAELYEIDDSLIAAAAQDIPFPTTLSQSSDQHAQWLQSQPQATKDAWLAQLMSKSHATVRSVVTAEFQKNREAAAWPTVRADRTIAKLQFAAAEIHKENTRKAEATAARKRAKMLAEMAKNPAPTLRETEQLVTQRTQIAYHKIAQLLSDLRRALAGTEKSGLAEEQAQKLKKAYPTLKLLNSELRRVKLLGK